MTPLEARRLVGHADAVDAAPWSVQQAHRQASYQTDPAWAAKLVTDALQLDEIRRFGT